MPPINLTPKEAQALVLVHVEGLRNAVHKSAAIRSHAARLIELAPMVEVKPASPPGPLDPPPSPVENWDPQP